jgi:hypothetical protein
MSRNNALNINRLSKYNFKFISLEEVILLEYFITYYQKGNLDIVVPNRIELETGLKRNKIVKASEELSEKGFLSVNIDKLRTHYKLNLDEVINGLNEIFIKDNKYAMQYFYFVQNPGAFKKSKNKKVATATTVTSSASSTLKKEVKPKAKAPAIAVQTSLF